MSYFSGFTDRCFWITANVFLAIVIFNTSSHFFSFFFCRWSFISDHFPTVFVAICFEAPGPGFLIDLKGADSGYVRRSSVRGSIHWQFRKSRLCSFTRELSALTSLFARLPKNLLKMHNDSIDDDRTQGIKTMIRIMEKSSGSYFFWKRERREMITAESKSLSSSSSSFWLRHTDKCRTWRTIRNPLPNLFLTRCDNHTDYISLERDQAQFTFAKRGRGSQLIPSHYLTSEHQLSCIGFPLPLAFGLRAPSSPSCICLWRRPQRLRNTIAPSFLS